MLRSAQRLKHLNFSASLRTIRWPSASSTVGIDYAASVTKCPEANNRHDIPPFPFPAISFISHRCFSTTQSSQVDEQQNLSSPLTDNVMKVGEFHHKDALANSTGVNDGELFQNTTFDETMEKIFAATQQQMLDADAAEAAVAAAKQAGMVWDPVMWKPTDLAVEAIRILHETTGWEYGWSIIGVTVLLRVALLPLFAKAQINQSRMAHMTPELTLVNERYKAMVHPTPEETAVYAKQLSALYKKYNCNPFRSLWLPVIQLPAFLGMFFGLQKMTKYPVFHNELATGGILWFPDLTVPDPMYILSLSAALTFLGVIELSRKTHNAPGMDPATQNMMHNVFRGLAIIMIPTSITFPSAVVAYWVTNNLFTFFQMALFAYKPVKKYLGIWDPPKPVPGAKTTDVMETINNLFYPKPTQEQLIAKHNDKVSGQQKMKELSKQALALRREGRKVGKDRN